MDYLMAPTMAVLNPIADRGLPANSITEVDDLCSLKSFRRIFASNTPGLHVLPADLVMLLNAYGLQLLDAARNSLGVGADPLPHFPLGRLLLEISLATTHSLFFSLALGKILARSRSPHFSLAAARSRFRFGV